MSAVMKCFFAMRGPARRTLTASTIDVEPETMMLIGRGAIHKVTNTGKVQMRLLWGIWPAGLEDWFQDIGKPRQPSEPMPPPFSPRRTSSK